MSITDPDYDPDDEELDPTDDTPVIRKLRKELREARKDSKRAAELESELRTYRSRDAFDAAELSLNPSQQRAVLNELADPGDLSPESLRKASETLGFYTPPDPTVGTDAEAQRQMAAAAAGGASPNGADGMLKPSEFASWDMARRVDFMERHPEKMAAIERGESVRV